MTPANEIMRNYIYKNSNIPAYYLNNNINLSPETEDIEAFYRLKNIENQCVRFFREHWNLNLYSNTVGNGKTSWAIKIVRAYIDTYACNYGNVDCLYINVPDFMALRKRGFDNPLARAQFNELQQRAMDAKVVIFDEIASKQSSDFDADMLYVIINHRVANSKSSIYTSNVLPNQLKTLLGERIADRIIGAPNTVNIELKGNSRRGEF